MGRWGLVLAVCVLFAFGIGVVKYFEESKEVAPTTKNITATIVDAIPWGERLVITVNADGKLYRIYTNATMVNTSLKIVLHFKDGKLVGVSQDGRTFGVLKYERLKTIEKMPVVAR